MAVKLCAVNGYLTIGAIWHDRNMPISAFGEPGHRQTVLYQPLPRPDFPAAWSIAHQTPVQGGAYPGNQKLSNSVLLRHLRVATAHDGASAIGRWSALRPNRVPRTALDSIVTARLISRTLPEDNMLMRFLILVYSCLAVSLLSGCDVEKQMDTMVDNPSFAEPLFAKFMARAEFQSKAIDTILADPAMRQMLLDKVVVNAQYAEALAQQLISNPATRDMVGQLINAAQMPAATPADSAAQTN